MLKFQKKIVQQFGPGVCNCTQKFWSITAFWMFSSREVSVPFPQSHRLGFLNSSHLTHEPPHVNALRMRVGANRCISVVFVIVVFLLGVLRMELAELS